MTPAERIGKFLALASIDRPVEKTIDTAKGKRVVTIELEPGELGKGYEAASDRLFALLDAAEQARDQTIAAAKLAISRAITVGEFLLEVQELFAGEYEEWLEGYCAGRISRSTAYNYKKAVRYKQALGSEFPDFATLKKLYVAAGILPPPNGTSPGSRAPAPLFRLKYEINLPPDPAKWDAVVRRQFIAEAKPVAALLQKAIEAEEDAA